jgi:hypothetical protein
VGQSNSGFNNVNNLANQNFQNYNTQRTNLGNTITAGLGQAQSNSQNAFNTAFGGYSNLLNQAAGGTLNTGGGGGGTGAAYDAMRAAINGMQGPGNPWAGELGTDIRTRNDSLLPGFYDRIRAEQGRLQNIQGGYNPGYTAQMAKLARDQAHQAQAAKLSTDVELGQRSAAAQAAQAAFANQRAMQLAQLGLSQAQYGAGNSRASAAMQLQARLAALSGISGLRGQTPGEVNMYLQGQLGNLGTGQGLNNQSLGQMYQANPRQAPWWQQAMGMVGPAASVASLFMGGGGGSSAGRLLGGNR